MSNLPAPAPDLYQSIRDVLLAARTQVRLTVNTAMVQTYWHVGRLIVEGEQGGSERAEYGKGLLPELAKRLSAEFGKGFSAPSLWAYRQFYLEFPILSTVWRELSWSHFRGLSRVKDAQARAWYANEAVTQGWSVRALDRQINTLFYERLLGSQDKAGVAAEAVALIAREAPPDPRDFIRDPYVLEFLGAQPDAGLYEQMRGEGDNPTLGLILCSERNAAVAKYSLLADKAQLFASKYQRLMPTEAELRAELERDRALLERARGDAP